MICPRCEMEYVESITTCIDCNTELVTVEDFEGNLIHHSDWAILYTTDYAYEAEMYKANLESAGIEVNILGQKDKSFPIPGDLSVIKLLIKKSDINAALEIIRDIETRKVDETAEESEEE